MRSRLDSGTVNSIVDLEQWDVLRNKLKLDKNGRRAKKMYGTKSTMLHLICKKQPPSDIIETLLKANPEAAFLKSDPYDELPLHHAFQRRMASTDVVRLLVKENPKAISTLSGLGVSPIHQACTFHAPYETLKVLVDAEPEVLSLEDDHHRTPWDVAKVQYSFLNPMNWRILCLLWGKSSRS
mmetsp:Transcript_26272/g.30519  ORF Transcript_26272/g.30519 Transcript_26272/m.30519 type:complete len:182 (+) Transcript_26272:118-663(+)